MLLSAPLLLLVRGLDSRFASVFLQTAFGGIEGVSQRDVDVHVRLVLGSPGIHANLSARQCKLDPDAEWRTFAAMTCWCLDDHVTPCNALMESFEPTDVLVHARLDSCRTRHVPEGNAQWCLHDFVLRIHVWILDVCAAGSMRSSPRRASGCR